MDEFPLIVDLAFILIAAGVTSLICRALKLPILVGYLVAGLLTGPHFALLPTVTDVANIHTWSEIGVIFLLFALGLEFNFKSLIKVGKTGAITATTVVAGTLLSTWLIGHIYGWTGTQCVFIGGMLTISSTMIIVKAFEELNLKGQPFTKIVYGVEIVEDLVAILLLVVLPIVAMSQGYGASESAEVAAVAAQDKSLALEVSTSLMRMLFFMVIWFVAGIFLIPTALRKLKKLVNDEVLLVISLALCLGMVLLADYVQLSTALGAFVIGSILGSTPEAHRIESLMTPIKNLFGAIFFVSVGMMADPAVFLDQWPMILLILGLVVVVKPIMGTIGVYFSGQGLDKAIHAGFSFGHIGEFSFIIAMLGISLGVFEEYIYPVVIAVSVLTTITTPYVIRCATPVYHFLDAHLPAGVRRIFEGEKKSEVQKKAPNRIGVLLRQFFSETFILVVILVGIYALCGGIIEPELAKFLAANLPDAFPVTDAFLTRCITVALMLVCMLPFLSALVLRKSNLSKGIFVALIKGVHEGLFKALQAVRLLLIAGFLAFVLNTTSPFILPIDLAITAVLMVIILVTKGFVANYLRLENQFLFNYNEAENAEQQERSLSENHVSMNDIREGDWLGDDLSVARYRIDEASPFLAKTLTELNLRAQYGLFIIRIERGESVINIPAGNAALELDDTIYIVGKKVALRQLSEAPHHIEKARLHIESMSEFSQHLDETSAATPLRCIALSIGPEASFLNKKLRDSGIGAQTQCLVIGIENGARVVMNPSPDEILAPGARLWVVGEPDPLGALIRENLG